MIYVYFSNSFLLLCLSVLLRLSHLLQHHLLILLLRHFVLSIFGERWWCSVIVHHLTLWHVVISSTNLLLHYEWWLFLLWKCTNCVIFVMTVCVCWDQPVLSPVSWVLSKIACNFTIYYILFPFLIDLRLGSLLKKLLLPLLICHLILILNLNSLNSRLALGLILISILLNGIDCLITICWHCQYIHLSMRTTVVVELIVKTPVSTLAGFSWLLSVLSWLV